MQADCGWSGQRGGGPGLVAGQTHGNRGGGPHGGHAGKGGLPQGGGGGTVTLIAGLALKSSWKTPVVGADMAAFPIIGKISGVPALVGQLGKRHSSGA